MKSRLQKLANKTFISKVGLRYLHPWLRKGNNKLRLQLIRCMDVPKSLPKDETHDTLEDLYKEFACKLVQTLVDVASGESRSGSKKNYQLYPYGKDAANTYNFKTKVPNSFFSITLTELYPFLLEEVKNKKRWSDLLKGCHHKMTGLWPLPLMRRYMAFRKTMNEHREKLFQIYEKEGGTFFDVEDMPATKRRRTSPRKRKKTTNKPQPPSSDDDFGHVDLP